MVKINLDGKDIQVQEEATILAVAKENQIDIPTLCYEKRLDPFGSCWLCVVEVEGVKNLVPSCATKVREGMIIRTKTSNINQARRLCLELLLSDHYGDCLPPCQSTCPAEIDIKRYLSLAREGNYQEAIKVIKENNPLPLVCGRVCVRPCEEACRRKVVDEPVAIDFVKRFIADYDHQNGSLGPEVKESSGQRVALIGGGPASLSAAYYLSLNGHSCTVYEALPKLGGMLRYGIPEYRLPKKILDDEIKKITDLGVKVKTNLALGFNFTLEDLKREYQAIFIGLGSHGDYKLEIEGEELAGVLFGVTFLRDLGLGKEVKLRGRVAVIGGGNTAIDAARSALRLGATEVIVIYRRTEKEMPANEIEIKEAKHEGVKFHFLSAPVKAIGEDGKVVALECLKMELGELDKSGRRRPVPILNSEFIIKLDFVIAAVGQFPQVEALKREGIEISKRGTVAVKGSYLTNSKGVFAGGDVVTGAATVIEAIASGKKAAISIDRYLKKEELSDFKLLFTVSKGRLEEIDKSEYEEIERKARVKMPELDLSLRLSNFKEVELGLSEEEAKKEASRCLECGCKVVEECSLRKYGLEYEADLEKFKTGAKHKYLLDASHPKITRDPNKCIRCGQCVRICLEIKKIGALSFTKRGFETIVEPPFELNLASTNCDGCGECVISCPTGALFSQEFPKKKDME
ncbi:FAD-dependent oxidoreductase [bacterium]|nr:FAD-dependent oxidoreductase [bacterium]MBU1154051.1 FAD-dependent oxidoreductase [bacterium]MBU1782536.1 FAD-dependent oxidoreductase [bacterium]